MRALETLAAQAVVGTDRQPPAWPEAPGAVGDMLRQLTDGEPDPALTLLRTAGVLAVCRAAGYRPPAATENPPDPCPPETLRPAEDPPLAAVLSRILADGPERLQAEALRRLAEAGCRLPHNLLPQALDLGRRHRALRPALLGVLGQRGIWLARQNPDWAFAAGGVADSLDIAAWETGSPEQRALYLRRCRESDPARGRELYAQALPELGARERAALLAEFAAGLGADDEDFLETALRDRGKEVRQTAASLLVRLPDSRYAGRMAARLDACLKTERKLLRSVLAIEAPEAFGADWKADALEDDRPKSEPLGQRAWWLYQLARSTPLSWWEARTGLKPAELLDWSAKSEWQDALWRGWLDVLAFTADVDWAEAFLERKPKRGVDFNAFVLIQRLPLKARERHWLRRVEKSEVSAVLSQICASLPPDAEPVSAEFARRMLERVRDFLAQKEAAWDYALRSTLPEFACLIPPELFPEVQRGWAVDRPDSPFLTETAVRFLAILEQRAVLHHHPLLSRTDP
jgi:hypothetical protein